MSGQNETTTTTPDAKEPKAKKEKPSTPKDIRNRVLSDLPNEECKRVIIGLDGGRDGISAFVLRAVKNAKSDQGIRFDALRLHLQYVDARFSSFADGRLEQARLTDSFAKELDGLRKYLTEQFRVAMCKEQNIDLATDAAKAPEGFAARRSVLSQACRLVKLSEPETLQSIIDNGGRGFGAAYSALPKQARSNNAPQTELTLDECVTFLATHGLSALEKVLSGFVQSDPVGLADLLTRYQVITAEHIAATTPKPAPEPPVVLTEEQKQAHKAEKQAEKERRAKERATAKAPQAVGMELQVAGA
jgi:hypothetical protein